jgi:AraC-like DNA-binding protein/quercetin dioxygenase-like cupin family protein
VPAPGACQACDVVAEASLGTASYSLTFRHFSIAQVFHEAGARYARHAHERAYLAFVQQGSHQDQVGRESEVAQSATVVVMPSGVAHANRIGGDGARMLLVTLEPTLRELARLPARWRVLRGGPVARVFVRLRQTLALAAESERATIEELLLELVDVVAETREPVSEGVTTCVRAARTVLNDSAFEPFLLRDVARATRVDAAYLSRAFRRAEGCTMGEYRRRLRARKAAVLLAKGRMPIAEVAFITGFADQSHLSRVFKTEFGVTPLRFQRLMG